MGKKISKIVIDRNACIGAASCVMSAGEIFMLNGENKAVAKLKGGGCGANIVERASLEADVADEVLLAAAESCPTHAITFLAEDGSQLNP